MTAHALEIPLPDQLEREIAHEAGARGKSRGVLGLELLTEAIRMRRVPGIVFADGPAGRRAMLAGTGLDVWEVIATWKEQGQDAESLRQSYPWLTQPQLHAALTYYEKYPEAVDERLAREEGWTAERIRRELPFSGR